MRKIVNYLVLIVLDYNSEFLTLYCFLIALRRRDTQRFSDRLVADGSLHYQYPNNVFLHVWALSESLALLEST